MTFDDIDHVDIDYDENTFTIIRKNGAVNGAYDISAESELLDRILSHADEVPVYSLSSFEVDEYGNRYYEEF